ncbi:hypothetical protein EUX98_g8580 [Antrodiella citrinella]|uniref:Uncharacterized protein n=1 Tax=Antrodiella citrinella TaxID=2447956 RepID=A0A4V3XG85_9APHY|nr:hypothetical protein EUX98_g8580 [Antrodiella citrinella]
MSHFFTFLFRVPLPSTHCPVVEQLNGYPICQLRPGHDYPFHLPPQIINVVDILHSNERTVVYLGLCEDNTELALKFSNIEDISAEVGAYDAFEGLHGTVLPKMYGALIGKDRIGKKIPCLVLERFGDRLTRRFGDLQKTEKAKILNKLAEAHRAGLFPLPFSERHVVVKDDDYRLIGLGCAERHDPPCCWTYDFTAHVQDDDIKPTDPSAQCGSLKSWAEYMRFWDHGKLILSRTILISKSDKLPPQHIVDRLSTAIGMSSDHDYIMTDRKQIGAKYLAIVWEQMTKHGMLLEDVQKLLKYYSYLAHKEWHEERNEVFVPLPGMNFSAYKPR